MTNSELDALAKLIAQKMTEMLYSDMIGVEEVSDMTGLSKRTIYNKCSMGSIPHYKVCGKLRFRRSDIISMIALE